MDAQDEKFFESLAGGAKIETAAASGEEVREMGSYEPAPVEVELARAETAPVASRSRARATAKVSAANDPAEPEGQLTVDVFQTPDSIIVESAIAGVRPEDLDVNVTPDSVSIRGAREHERTAESEDYIYQECYWGRFARSIILPQEIDPEGADVRLRNGILTIRLPKANKRKSRKLSVRTD